MAVSEIMASFMVIIIGGGLIAWRAILTCRAIRHQRELAARRGDPGSQQALEDYIREIDQATSDADITRLDQERKGDG